MLARPDRVKEDVRKELLKVAIDCFAKHGYTATSIDRIAKAAGVTKGALYYHFKDKEELLLESVRTRIGQFEKRVAEELRSEESAARALQALARICFDHATRSNHRRLIVTLMVEALDTHPALEALFREMMQRFRSFLSGVIRDGQRRGEFRSDADPRLAAELFAGAVMGAEIQYYQDPAHFDLRRALETYSEQFVQWLAPSPRSRRATSGNKRRSDHGEFRAK
jgi:TetR/AcrR family acrAB operon transcriptional repressor